MYPSLDLGRCEFVLTSNNLSAITFPVSLILLDNWSWGFDTSLKPWHSSTTVPVFSNRFVFAAESHKKTQKNDDIEHV